jgi:hypothetical protein
MLHIFVFIISTEQSPSWEADSHSASHEILPAFYGTRRFITEEPR